MVSVTEKKGKKESRIMRCGWGSNFELGGQERLHGEDF